MRLHARGVRGASQLVGDVLTLGWVACWVWWGTGVHGLIADLAAPARQTATTSQQMAGRLREASQQLGRVPAIGDDLGGPFNGLAADLDTLVAQANRQVEIIQTVAWVGGVLTAVVPIAMVLLLWLPRRVRFVRNAAAAQRFIDAEADLDLFALRALAHQPLPTLARLSDDPMGAWRRGDPQVVHALARLELDRVGLSMPRQDDPGLPGVEGSSPERRPGG